MDSGMTQQGMAASGLEGWRFRAVLLSVLAATAGYLAFSLWSGWQDVADAFVLIGWLGTGCALALSLVNYGLRFGRWQLYLSRLGHPVEYGSSLRIYLSGFALTTTPGKAGELFRGVLLKQRGIPFPASCAAFVSERLSDLVAIILLALFGLSYYPQAQVLIMAGSGGVLLLLILLAYRPLMYGIQAWAQARTDKIGSLVRNVIHMLLEARSCHTPGLVVGATLISLIAWGAEALAFYWVLGWLGVDLPLAYAVFVYALSMLAGALSFLPGGLGGAEASMIGLLLLQGMSMPEAVAATVFIRLATLWFAVALGLIALYMSRKGEAA